MRPVLQLVIFPDRANLCMFQGTWAHIYQHQSEKKTRSMQSTNVSPTEPRLCRVGGFHKKYASLLSFIFNL